MVETIFILTVSLLPCLVYLSVGIYVVFKMRGKWDGGDEAASGLVRDVVILVFAIALCYLSGGAHILCGADGSFSDVTDRIVIKLYVASSLLPCIVVKRYVFQDRSWLPFCIPAVFILLLIMFTDAMAFADIDSFPGWILFRGSVIIAIAAFCVTVYVYCAYGPVLVEEGRHGHMMDLFVHLLLLSVYNFLVLIYSFRLHVMFDYFVLVIGFAVAHIGLMVSTLKYGHALPPSRMGAYVRGCGNTSRCGQQEYQSSVRFRDGMPAEFEDDSALPLKDRLINYFESEKPYLSKDISMQEVAMRLFTNKSYLSKTINMEMNKNFRELVNYFRVKEAMRIFSASPDMSMNELRDRSGFNNNASFTSAFKLNTGCTPGEWCRDMKNRIYEEERRTVNGKGQDI